MEIKRDYYLNQLIEKKEDGMVKIITGIRRCGKSYLLDPIFKGYLIDEGVDKEHIIKIELDRASNIKYHKNPELLEEHIHSMIRDEKMYYVILDEIQLVDGFEFVVSGLLYERNVDVYITGSNSKFLSILYHFLNSIQHQSWIKWMLGMSTLLMVVCHLC